MKKLALIVSAAILAAAGPALADEWDFMLTNATGKLITKIEVAPAGSGSWVDNKVDAELNKDGKVKPGARTTVHFEKAASACKFDLRATFEDKTDAVWPNINLCDNSYVTVAFTGDKPTFKAN
ncbi:hypothetical protein CA233_12000 [Sphingomonas sp. ABOLD]|uniref:Argininosuccinate lyase n=1 Tax=Sphingomonas trueperi TaxID=53317 RepID=A0A7X5XVN7_9SPHN|nr:MULTISPECIES: hypothetical protein [Sphingomonas]NJB95845.1 hypothetical protein [Sphingomonas trueperi]RSV47116.1 hypothetical protein CA233_12000 [Sphingomonas sp. ABOLD]